MHVKEDAVSENFVKLLRIHHKLSRCIIPSVLRGFIFLNVGEHLLIDRLSNLINHCRCSLTHDDNSWVLSVMNLSLVSLTLTSSFSI